MVSTRSSTSTLVTKDENRIVAVVTGANSGYGLGICQMLLRCLSLPPGEPLPESAPQLSAMPPFLRHLYPGKESKLQPGPPPTLTLVIVCRKSVDAEATKKTVLAEHYKDLEKRKRKGKPVREGWRDGLKIQLETCEFSLMGGKNGILQLCQRLNRTLPHITSLFLNAGMAAFAGVDYFHAFRQIWRDGLAYAFSHPEFMVEIPGLCTDDGRGMVWSVNTLAPYTMTTELMPLLRRSPSSLPFSPRVMYTSSGTATFQHLPSNPLDDYQLIEYPRSYSPSKYMCDLIFCQLDKTYGNEIDTGREVRCFVADPGAMTTGITRGGFGPFMLLQEILFGLTWLAFYLARLGGSPWHSMYPTEGVRPLLYAAFVDPLYLPSANKIPSPKFLIHASRWGHTTVDFSEVDSWVETEEIGIGLMERCEQIRLEWRRREGIE
ncbi:hypothetical protein TREMEDRAFT_43600 [Tremella mesenterica DSM 1558]|uniref:uncharacterized protein n=1 Tax=Tremella mesenterica (strain ATCC 24925 / CBS 8224 / DSM 1558 / NBRC 9311 / NRRL Y-6157 / RJB 2259-6 / UBC 559-6) TaxID=578456 RepID=UPI0003F496E6|nr:uncharacterized protein TREMEDRAFT_43600 [Tremella mesenterica DSM 1558]EIW69967.1 hypothetical protein TREMEDRAFT_43600 [Tremella mesenterica DSM 1558]